MKGGLAELEALSEKAEGETRTPGRSCEGRANPLRRVIFRASGLGRRRVRWALIQSFVTKDAITAEVLVARLGLMLAGVTGPTKPSGGPLGAEGVLV